MKDFFFFYRFLLGVFLLRYFFEVKVFFFPYRAEFLYFRTYLCCMYCYSVYNQCFALCLLLKNSYICNVIKGNEVRTLSL